MRAEARPWRAEVRACAALSLPLAATNAVEMAMGAVGAALVGHLAPAALAAVTLAGALYIVALVFGIGLTAAVPALIAQEVGRAGPGDAAVGRVLRAGLWNAALVSVPLCALLWWTEPALGALGQDPALSRAAGGYMRVAEWGLPPALAYLTLRGALAALGRPRWAVLAGIAAVGVNAALNLALIGGVAGLVPAFGIAGSAAAALLSNLFLLAALLAAARADPALRALALLRGLARPPWRTALALGRLGLPIGVGLVLEAGAFSAATALVGRSDPAALPAHAVALQVASLAFMVPLGIGQAATVRVGLAAGAGQAAAARRAGWSALALGVAATAASALLMLTLPGPIVRLFIDPAAPGGGAVARGAAMLLALAGAFQLADGAQVVLAGMLRGLGDTRGPAVIAALGYWAFGVPLAALLAPRAAAPGVWVGLAAGLFAVAAMLLARWRARPAASPASGVAPGGAGG